MRPRAYTIETLYLMGTWHIYILKYNPFSESSLATVRQSRDSLLQKK